VVMEEDLLPSKDFLRYMQQAAALLERDPSVFVASAWNDNGHNGMVSDESMVLRGDHFMALGWLLTRKSYQQVVTCTSPNCWMGCPGDTSGLAVCLGQWDTPFKGYMHSQQEAGVPLVGVFPEVPRVHHLFEGQGFTTFTELQQHWFDNLAISTITSQAATLDASLAAAEPFREATSRLLANAVVLAEGTNLAGGPGCIHDILHMRQGVMALYIAAQERGDHLWAQVASGLSSTIGYSGREGFIPRGITEGVVRFRYGGHQLLVVGAYSLHASSSPTLRVRVPYDIEAVKRFFHDPA
ncbi:hypothetical protein CYMTET_19928, partial [Cymbomonas tetramitiformis]